MTVNELINKIKEKVMPKPQQKVKQAVDVNVVKFNRTETPKPKKRGAGNIALRSPIPFTLAAKSDFEINLNMTCNTTLVLLSSKAEGLVRGDRAFVKENTVIHAGENIKFVITNPRETDQLFEFGDTIVLAAPWFSVPFEIE